MIPLYPIHFPVNFPINLPLLFVFSHRNNHHMEIHGAHGNLHQIFIKPPFYHANTWWFIPVGCNPSHKWTNPTPFIARVITYLLSGMNHQACLESLHPVLGPLHLQRWAPLRFLFPLLQQLLAEALRQLRAHAEAVPFLGMGICWGCDICRAYNDYNDVCMYIYNLSSSNRHLLISSV